MAMNIDNKLSVINTLDGNFFIAFPIGYFLGKGIRIGISILFPNSPNLSRV
jgi:hypothetical protein